MTFTEAAIEVLRRAGKPLHYKDIAEAAVRESLLSHVGQDPETTMGQRLAAMARREEERRVVAIAPDGTFALTEWSVPADLIVEAKPPPVLGDDGEKPYRPREREPRPIHTQARRRMEAIAAGEEVSDVEKPERPEKPQRQERGDRKRSNVPAEACFDWLAHRQSGAPIAEMAAELAAKGTITDALAHDLPSLTAMLLEDNRRRTEAGRKPAFIVDGERVTLVEFPSPTSLAQAEPDRSPQTSLGRPASAAALVQEGKRACVRALRTRLADLETAGFEHVCTALLEKMGMRDLRVAKRSKDGPLFLARQRWGVSDLRVAVRLVRGRREISRQDVTELRKDLAHYSAQLAILLTPGEAGREARADASAAAQPPVALFAGESLAEELVELRVGVSVEMVEIADVDEAFFAAARALKGGRESRGPRDSQDARTGEATSGNSTDPGEADAPAGSSTTTSEAPEAKSEAAPSAGSESAAAPTVTSSPAETPSADKRPDESRGGRRPRRGDREETPRPRMVTPADQAWGQPAGTPRKGVDLTAPVKAEPTSAPAPDSAPELAAEGAPGVAVSESSSSEVGSAPADTAPATEALVVETTQPTPADPTSEPQT
jgi:ribonuclease E